jgi:hypothetical protein
MNHQLAKTRSQVLCQRAGRDINVGLEGITQ